jgi:hypothetical protein
MQRNGPNTPGGKQRWRCFSRTTGYCYGTTDPTRKVARKQDGSPQRSKKIPLFKRSLGGVTRFLVTAAQNGTPAHKGFVDSLESAANHLNAEIVCIPLRYKNPTSKWTESQANDEVWADEVQPYLFNKRKKLNSNLVLLADIKTQPTASSPLSGFEAITHGESGILGHTKLQLRSIPTPQSRLPKLLTTTGACTERNFTDSKAGKLGEFHATLGACLVELSGKAFHMRQINADKTTGEFQDLDVQYSPTGAIPGNWIEALVTGDTHVDFIDSKVLAATQEMIQELKPRVVALHDLLDGYSVNHHHRGNVFNAIAKIRGNLSDPRAEVERAIAFADAMAALVDEVIVVPSNHDDFLRQWIVNTDPRTVPGAFEFWCETALAMSLGTKLGSGGMECPDPFTYWARRWAKAKNVKYLDRDDSYQVAGGIELGLHGDRGPNGSRGSAKNLRRIGVRSVIGHSHTPAIDEGAYQTGTSTGLKLEYTSGPSSWLNTHCIVYPNGKRSLINIIDGRWKL